MKHLLFLLVFTTPVLFAQNDSIPSKTLKEVGIVAEKPQIKSENGIMSVDLPSIIKNKPVSNILEALSYLPGVINIDNHINLAGAQSTAIIINGKVSSMPVSNLYQFLKSLPVDRLKSVEVMHTAPAKYHVDGAVINVILKTPSVLDGLQGQVRAEYDQAHYASFTGGLSATYATRNWTFDLNYSLSRAKKWGSEDMESWHSLGGAIHKIDDNNSQFKYSLPSNIYAAIGYNFSKKSNIQLSYNGQISSNAHNRSNSTNTFGTFVNDVTFNAPSSLHYISAVYLSPFGLSLSADYTSYSEGHTKTLRAIPSTDVLSQFHNVQDINRYHFSADMEHDISGWTLGYGIDYRLSHDTSSQHYIIPASEGFSNTLNEHSAEAYVSLMHQFPSGLSFTASVGEEYYHVADENNWTFQPRLSMTYFKNPRHIIQASLSSNRNYPSFWELHSGKSAINPYSEIWGNPSLRPSTTYMAQLSYIFRQKYSATLYHSYTDKYSVQLPYQSTDSLKLIFQNINFNYHCTVGLNITAPFSIGKWFNTRLTLNGFYNCVKADHFHDMSFARDKWVLYSMIANTFRLSRNLSISLDASFITPSLQGLADMSSLWRIDTGAKWTFLKGNAELTLRVDDLFNRWSPTMRINYGTQNYKMKINDMSHNLKVSFIYRFNGFKPKKTHFDSSRFGTK